MNDDKSGPSADFMAARFEQHVKDTARGSPLVEAGLRQNQADLDRELQRLGYRANEAAVLSGPRADSLEASVATPDELVRTAVRILLLNLHHGLSRLKPRLRQSVEARAASQAIYAASEFFNREYDPTRADAELQRLGNALLPLVSVHR